MILGARMVETPAFLGINLILLRDWILPVDTLGSHCFKSFDEALSKLKTDTEATRILSEDPPLTEIATASEASLRSLPDRYRNSGQLYSLAIVPDVGYKGKSLLWNLPPWAHVTVENTNGELFEVSARPSEKGWKRLSLNKADLFVHVSLFRKDFEFRLLSPRAARFMRLSQLVEESQNPSLVKHWELSLHPRDLL